MNKAIDFKEIGNLIFKLRNECGYTQRELAEIVGVTKSSVSQWESGKGNGLKTENIYDLSIFFGITFSEMINGRLNDENENDYLKRNYDLSEFSHSDFSGADDSEISNYLKKCCSVNDKFYDLLKKYINMLTSESEENLLKYLLKNYELSPASYKKFDLDYWINPETYYDRLLQKIKDEVGTEKESADEFEYCVSSIIHFRLNSGIKGLFESGNSEIIGYYFELLPVIERNNKFVVLVNSCKTNADIQNNLAVNVMSSKGAKYIRFSNFGLYSTTWRESNIEELIGKVAVDYKRSKLLNLLRSSNIPDFASDLVPYEEYMNYYDEYETRKINCIVKYRHNDPYKYIQAMSELDNEIFNDEEK